MDPERTFLRLARLTFARLLAPRFRRALEKLCLFNALMLLSLLVIMHVNFVSQPGCSAKFAQNDTAEAQLIQVKITGSWNSLVDSTLRSWAQGKAKVLYVNGKLKFADEFEDGQVKRILSNPMGKIKGEVEDDKVAHEISSDDGRAGRSFAAPRRGSLGTSLAHYLTRWSNYCRQVWRLAGWEPFAATPKVEQGAAAWNQLDSVSVEQMDKESTLYDPIYLYSIEKGYLILSEAAKSKHNIHTVNISISAHDECFGNRWLQLLIDNFVGYDTILMNSLLSRRQRGYLYNYQTKELYNLNYIQQSGGVLQDYVVLKFGILIMSLFVFFTTTMSVSFTLRETRLRMLKFTVQLHHHARHRLPTFRLTFFHVFESLVFVPIMIGILFFLFEFFDDQLLAFMVLTLVWLCELFTIISVRTPVSRKYFPRFFFLYFLAFHIYFFSYTYGFSYLAFSATVAFMQHLVLYFWNRFEAPALLTYLRGRALLQQQGFHVTSILTSILTSAVQVARINLMDTTLPETSVNDNSLRTEEAPVESRDGSRPILGATFGIAGDAEITSTESSRLHGPNRSVTGTNSNESTQTSSEGITSSGTHSIAAPLTVIQSVFPSWIVRSSGGLVSLLSVRPAVQEDNSDAPNSDGGGVSQTITDESGLRHRHAFGTENNEIR